MKLWTRVVVNVIPILFSATLWATYFVNKQNLILAILMSLYSVLLHLTVNKKPFEGVIEFRETQEGSKKFQLIIDKDPNTFQDEDQVTFVVKKIAG